MGQVFNFESLGRELNLLGRPPEPCLVARIRGVAPSSAPAGIGPWLVRDSAYMLPGLFVEVAAGRFVYNFRLAGDALVALYEGIEKQVGRTRPFALDIGLVLPPGAVLVEPSDGFLPPILANLVWVPTDGTSISSDLVHSIEELIRDHPEHARHAGIGDWLRESVHVRGVLLELGEQGPHWLY